MSDAKDTILGSIGIRADNVILFPFRLTPRPDGAHIAITINPKKEGTFVVSVFHDEKSCTPISVNAAHDEAIAVARARARKTGMAIMDFTVPDDGPGDAA
jgi:hypothetical protein